MRVQLGNARYLDTLTNSVTEFNGQECPWVQAWGDDGIKVTYYESLQGRECASPRPSPQKRVTLILSRDERARLKGLL
jgi:hypothetical protein